MEDDLSNFHHEDDALDRELNSLVREMEHEEAVRRAVIEMLVMLGSDAALRFACRCGAPPKPVRGSIPFPIRAADQ
jgi:hypothetical protein